MHVELLYRREGECYVLSAEPKGIADRATYRHVACLLDHIKTDFRVHSLQIRGRRNDSGLYSLCRDYRLKGASPCDQVTQRALRGSDRHVVTEHLKECLSLGTIADACTGRMSVYMIDVAGAEIADCKCLSDGPNLAEPARLGASDVISIGSDTPSSKPRVDPTATRDYMVFAFKDHDAGSFAEYKASSVNVKRSR